MNNYEIIFWTLLFLVFYTYLGYGIVLIILVKIKELFVEKLKDDGKVFEPRVTMFVAAFNEKDFIEEKIQNMLELDYPKDKIQLLFVTDGSNDGTPEMLKKYPEVSLMHKNDSMDGFYIW